MLTIDSTRAFKQVWFILRIQGLHPPVDDTFWARHYTVYMILFQILTNICIPITFYMECILSSSLTKFCETFCVACLIALGQAKLINTKSILNRLKDIHFTLKQLDKRLRNEMERDIISCHIRKTYQNFVWIVRLFAAILITATLLVACSPNRTLPFSAWYPWDWQGSSTVYFWTVVFQLFSIYCLSCVAILTDTYPMTYLFIVAAHYRALALRISMLGQNNELPSTAYKKLIGCIKDHTTILSLVSTIQDALSSIIFYQFAVTASSLCTLTFYCSFIEISVAKFLNLFFLYVGVVFETFILCHAAEEVADGADQMCQAIYDCNWMDQDTKFKRSLLLMLKRSQRPGYIISARLLPVRMTTLLAVVKTSYSMFTLLQKIK